MKIVFMGTPEFAAGSLEALIAAGHEIVMVVTQPDREKGRGKQVQCSAVKECALKHGLPVFQPIKIKDPESVDFLAGIEADIFVVAAFGQILSSQILAMPRLGCVNVHASLLPKYRGAAPIQWSIIDGQKETGVTIMQMDAGLDTGDMLTKAVIPISDAETGDSLHDKLMDAGARLLVETLPLIEEGSIIPEIQRNEDSCYARMLTKDMGRLDFTKTSAELDRIIRGLNSWPCAFTRVEGKMLKIWDALPVAERAEGECGEIRNITKDSFDILTGEGSLRIQSVQLEGKKRMTCAEFLRGFKLTEGSVLPS